MDDKYILGSDGELYHWGIKGMRWGIRRYQTKDGSLTPAGRKRYDKDMEKIKAETKRIKNQQATDKKLSKLEEAKKNLADLKRGKKSVAEDVEEASPKDKAPKKNGPTTEMSDKELQNTVNRLRNEDAYKDLTKKLGYDTPTTEMDIKIAELKRQKEYLELKRDINNLTPEKVSLGKKIAKTLIDDVIGPAATKAGKEVLEKYLKDTGMDAVAKVLGEKAKKEADKLAKEKEKTAKKEAEDAAKKEAEMQKYRDFQEAYKKSLEPDHDTSTSYRNKGGERGYINPNETRELAVVTKSAEKFSSKPVTDLSTEVSSRGQTYINKTYNNWDDYVDVTNDPTYKDDD